MAPHEEVRLIRSRGAIFDAIIGLRSGSPTFKQRLAVVLSADNAETLCVPEGFTHGFQTLEGSTEVFYQMPQRYVQDQDHARCVRWNDPAFGIERPADERTILNGEVPVSG